MFLRSRPSSWRHCCFLVLLNAVSLAGNDTKDPNLVTDCDHPFLETIEGLVDLCRKAIQEPTPPQGSVEDFEKDYGKADEKSGDYVDCGVPAEMEGVFKKIAGDVGDDADDDVAAGQASSSFIRVSPASSTDERGSWPWMASAGYRNEKGRWVHKCGATVVSRRHVLTAAHCILEESIKAVRIGDVDLDSDADDEGAFDTGIVRTFVHPSYNRVRKEAYYDVGLWEVQPFNYSTYVKPVCLPARQKGKLQVDKYQGQQVTLTGWGLLGRNEPKKDNVLNKALLQIFQQRYCNQTHGPLAAASFVESIRLHLPRLFQDTVMCAGYEREGGGGSCKGDSGGPLVRFVTRRGRRAHYAQVAVVTSGIGACGDENYPGIYARMEEEEIMGFVESVLLNANEPIPRIQGPSRQFLVSTVFRLDDRLKFAAAELDRTINRSGHTLLTWAVDAANLPAVKVLLEVGDQDPNEPMTNGIGWTPLHIAIARPQKHAAVYLTWLLLQQPGIDVNAKTALGSTPAIFAATFDRPEVVPMLAEAGADLDLKDVTAGTPLTYAMTTGHEAVAAALLRSGASPSLYAFGYQPVHVAAFHGMADIVRILVEEHDVNPDAPNYDRETPFMKAAQGGSTDVARYLVSTGRVDVNQAENRFNYTALDLACKFGQEDTAIYISSLEELEVDKLDTNGRSSLMHCAASGLRRAVRALVRAGAEVGRWDSAQGETALLQAASKGQAEAVEVLLELGANPNDRYFHNTSFLTALHRSCMLKNEELALVLLSDPRTRVDLFGSPPLPTCAEAGLAGAVSAILSRQGVDVDAVGVNGATALELAAENGHLDAVKVLAKEGGARDDGGKALVRAARSGHTEVALYLMEHAGSPIDAVDRGVTALLAATAAGQCETALRLVSKGANVSAKAEDSGDGVLHLVAASEADGCFELARVLVSEKGLNCSTVNDGGMTSLHVACENGRLDLLRLFKDREVLTGDALDARDAVGKTPLAHAAETKDESTAEAMVELLLEAGSKPDATSVLSAVEWDRLGLLKLLEDRAGSLVVRRETLEFLAVESRSCRVLRYLRGNRDEEEEKDVVDLLLLDDNRSTPPLHVVARAGDADLVNTMLLRGSDPGAEDSLGRTPLDLALEAGRCDVVDVLLKAESSGGA